MHEIKESCKVRFAPVVEAIRSLEQDQSKKQIIIALDGRCASGKTTLSHYLKELFDANLFHMDDFFLQLHQRTPKRLSEAGGNVDYERFHEEVIKPVLNGENVAYKRFDCRKMEIAEEVLMPAKRINLIEGSYSMHPFFGDIYDLKVFTDIDKENQIANVRQRNGAMQLPVFLERWIPKEEAYFSAFQIKEQSDIVVEWSKGK